MAWLSDRGDLRWGLTMPLDKSGSKAAFGSNVAAEIKAGRPMKQALAIAYSTQRAPKMAGGGSLVDALRGLGEFLSPSVIKPRGGNWMHYEMPAVDPAWLRDHPHVGQGADLSPLKISGLDDNIEALRSNVQGISIMVSILGRYMTGSTSSYVAISRPTGALSRIPWQIWWCEGNCRSMALMI